MTVISEGVVELKKSEKQEVHFSVGLDGVGEGIGQIVSYKDLNIPEDATEEEIEEILEAAAYQWAAQFIKVNYTT